MAEQLIKLKFMSGVEQRIKCEKNNGIQLCYGVEIFSFAINCLEKM